MTFKIINFDAEQQLFRSVNYFGIILQISGEHHWIATDEDGYVYAYSYKPWLGVTDWGRGCVEPDVNCLGNATFDGDWKESLMEIKNES